MKKKIDGFNVEEITNFKDRIQYYNDNEYRFQNELAVSDNLIFPINNDLAMKKLYLIAEDTCFDYLGAKYNENSDTIDLPQKKNISVESFREIIDTYRHAYINAFYVYKYGTLTAYSVSIGKAGYLTRLEAFVDLMRRKKQKQMMKTKVIK